MVNQSFELNAISAGIASFKVATDQNPYLEPALMPALLDIVQALKTDETIRVVVVEGDSQYFSAGANRETLLGAGAQLNNLSYAAEIPRALLSLPVPSVAAMAGHAIGGGLILGLWCDLAILAEESLYGANFMALGFTPGMGATVVLEEAVGAPLARELLFSGRLLKGREIKALGGALAHTIVPKAEVRNRAIAIAEEMAKVPREALVLLKQTLAGRRRATFEQAINEEQAMHAAIFGHKDTRLQIAESYPTLNAGTQQQESIEC